MADHVNTNEFPPEQYPYRIRNWSKFQHYKKRNPPWIKLHISMLSSEDWVVLDDASKLLAVVCMMIASKHEGHIPASASMAYFKRVAYLEKLPNLKPLIECGFLEKTLADAPLYELATARPETETETETETDKKEIVVASPTAPLPVKQNGTKKDGQPRRGVKTRISDDWKPSQSSILDAITLGFTEGEVMREAQKFRNHARQNERMVIRWDSAFDNWMIKAAEYANKLPSDPTGSMSKEQASPLQHFIRRDTPEWDQWQAWLRANGRPTGSPVSPRDNGWWFPSPLPPVAKMEESDGPATHTD